MGVGVGICVYAWMQCMEVRKYEFLNRNNYPTVEIQRSTLRITDGRCKLLIATSEISLKYRQPAKPYEC
jgi:hypothetical protein